MIIAVLILCVAVGMALANGEVAYIGVYPDETLSDCAHSGAYAPQISTAYVVLVNSIPLQQVSFRAPIPECIGLGGSYIYESSSFATTGNSQTGITVDLGGCTESPVTLLTIRYIGYADNPCCTWGVEPYSGAPYPAQIEVLDCNGVTRPCGDSVIPPNSFQACCSTFDLLAPYDPDPPDGTSGVPTNVTLSWLLPEAVGTEWIYISDNPYPPGIWCSIRDDYFTTFAPDNLQPNTTYYWMVGLNTSSDCYEGVRSEFWSFTTGEGPVATETTTWGRIKALYE